MSILFIILGILLVIGGFSCLLTPLPTMLAAGYIVGIMLLIYGIATLVRAIQEKEDVLVWIMSILSIIVGIFAIVNPGGTLALDTMIIYLFAADFLVQGIIEIILSIRMRGEKGWVLGLIAGILSVVLGVYSIIYPSFAAFTIGVLISLYFISRGFVMMTLGFSGAADD